jgi:hypothetical protein
VTRTGQDAHRASVRPSVRSPHCPPLPARAQLITPRPPTTRRFQALRERYENVTSVRARRLLFSPPRLHLHRRPVPSLITIPNLLPPPYSNCCWHHTKHHKSPPYLHVTRRPTQNLPARCNARPKRSSASKPRSSASSRATGFKTLSLSFVRSDVLSCLSAFDPPPPHPHVQKQKNNNKLSVCS